MKDFILKTIVATIMGLMVGGIVALSIIYFFHPAPPWAFLNGFYCMEWYMYCKICKNLALEAAAEKQIILVRE